MEFVPSLGQLSQIISQVVAPAFLLGAVAGFVSILASRMNGIIERMRFINDLPDGHSKSRLKEDLPRLRHRVLLLRSTTGHCQSELPPPHGVRGCNER